MSNFNDEICEYSYSTSTENFGNVNFGNEDFIQQSSDNLAMISSTHSAGHDGGHGSGHCGVHHGKHSPRNRIKECLSFCEKANDCVNGLGHGAHFNLSNCQTKCNNLKEKHIHKFN